MLINLIADIAKNPQDAAKFDAETEPFEIGAAFFIGLWFFRLGHI